MDERNESRGQGMTTSLKRVIPMPLLALYGMGNILGAGIYVLVGKVAGEAGYAAPYAFLVAALVASFTGLSYARLSARFPKSAGEANYALEAFNNRQLAFLIGLAIIISGLVSSSAILHGFAAYLQTFVSVPASLAIIGALVLLSVIAIWGIKESIMVTAVMTVIEILGLLYVLLVAWPDPDLASVTFEKANVDLGYLGFAIFGGAFVAFYAYVGFEDIVNVAEEVRDPVKSMPRALMSAVIVTSIIYVLVAFAAVARVLPDVLADSNAPLALIYESVSGQKPYAISVIALFAVVNGALVNIIMCSRVIYGMACNDLLPIALSKVSERTHTPVNATVFASSLVLIMALALPLLTLAKVTSFVLLIIFFIVNASCLKIWYKDAGKWSASLWLPLVGCITCLIMLCSPFF